MGVSTVFTPLNSIESPTKNKEQDEQDSNLYKNETSQNEPTDNEAGFSVKKDDRNEEISSYPMQITEKEGNTNESSQIEMPITKTEVEADDESKIHCGENDSNEIDSIKEKEAEVSVEKDNGNKESSLGPTQNAEKKGDTDEFSPKEMSALKTEIEADDESKIQSDEDHSNDMASIKEKEAGVSVEKDNVNKEISSGPTQNSEKKGDTDESSKKEMSTTKTEIKANDELKIQSENDHSNDTVSITEKEAGVSVEKDNVNNEISSVTTQNSEKKEDTNESNKKEMSTTKTEVDANDESKIYSDEDHSNDIVSIKEKEVRVSVEKDDVNKEDSSGQTQYTEKKGDTDESSKKEMSTTKTEVEADDELKICSDEVVIEQGVLHLVVVEGKELVNKDFIGKSDPYVKIIFNKQEFQSKKVRNDLAPKWNFSVDLNITQDNKDNDIEFKVFDDDFGAENFMGSFELSLIDAIKSSDKDGTWYNLEQCKTGKIFVSAVFTSDDKSAEKKTKNTFKKDEDSNSDGDKKQDKNKGDKSEDKSREEEEDSENSSWKRNDYTVNNAENLENKEKDA